MAIEPKLELFVARGCHNESNWIPPIGNFILKCSSGERNLCFTNSTPQEARFLWGDSRYRSSSDANAISSVVVFPAPKRFLQCTWHGGVIFRLGPKE